MSEMTVGEQPPRLKANPAEDPWHEDYRFHPERWIGASFAQRAKGAANLESAVGAQWVGGPLG